MVRAASGADPSGSAREVQALAEELASVCRHPWTLMEVCGGQTHTILRWGLEQLLPPGLRLLHGPGCPVCVTPASTLDAALALARRPGLILASFGDMLRVPASDGSSLLSARAEGADVRLVTAPLQALEIARANPGQSVVLLAVGFETTAPATALLARRCLALGVTNLSLLVAHVRIPPAMEQLLEPQDGLLQGFLAAGHVCSVMGTGELRQLVARRRLPVVVSGFSPVELLRGVLACVRQLEEGRAELVNAYGRVVRPEGNRAARALLEEVFTAVDRPWRGFGVIRGGGLALRDPYLALDARRRFALEEDPDPEREGPSSPGQDCGVCHGTGETEAAARAGGPPGPAAEGSGHPHDTGRPRQPVPEAAGFHAAGGLCIAGEVLRGRARPDQCPAFGGSCTPERPLGAPMVSSEGACAAYHRYRATPLPAGGATPR